MTANPVHPFTPDYATPPGETLRAKLEELNFTQTDLAERSGLSVKHVNQVIQGVVPLTQETAMVLERVTGTPAGVWNSLEARFRESRLREQKTQPTAEDEAWLTTLPVAELQKAGLVPRNAESADIMEGVLRFFGVADRSAWERVWSRPAAAFKRATAFESAEGAVATWLRLGELQVRNVRTAPFDAKSFRNQLELIRSLTRELDFSDRLRNACSSAGVALAFVPEIGKTRLSGAAWWQTPTRAVIQLSDRYKREDQFWFAFFHEAAHLLLHSKKIVFVDDGSGTGSMEGEANRFAGDVLIPPAFASRLASLATAGQVEEFADELGLCPGIVVGRLQHDNLWAWNRGRHLIRRLEITNG